MLKFEDAKLHRNRASHPRPGAAPPSGGLVVRIVRIWSVVAKSLLVWTAASTSRRCGKPLTVGLSRGVAADQRSLMMTKTVKVTKNLDFKHQNRRNSRLHHPDQTCRRHQCSLLACREVAHQDDGRIEADDEGWSDADEEPQRKILRGTTSGRSLGHSISGNAYRGRAQIVTKASAVARNAQGPEGNCAAASQANQCTSANQRGHQF